ncbi:MAG TPA: hypothetical protein DDW21_10930 [Verrucomicrobiales bacterium]|nr:MAG: hypothetical protein B9S37_00860 [Verrucomicrobiae bacterium Tous-C3TDCM]PAZ07004.1 MAG: hypothetical protein CAK88_01770 [Verrucomicrobiae bacterium AMD-G2]HBE23918.1 hypothetical protein [Verrucomicrobiales bacterium]
MSNTFVSVNDAVLVDTIGRAENRLVFIAPGLRPPVANALAGAMAVVPNSAIHLVLDVDAEVSRLGYGDKDFKGMEMLQAAAAGHGLTVNHHPGIRIGLLIADETTLIYSPTAESIETENRQPDKPNAILLQVELPQSLADACALGEDGHATLEVGKDVIDAETVAAVKRDLAARPAKDFNIARVERVFSSMLQYVEFEIESYKLSTRTLRLDAKLFGIRDEAVTERLASRYRLFSDNDSLTVEIPYVGEDAVTNPNRPKEKFGPLSVDKERNRIKKLYIIEVGKNRALILRRNVAAFEKEIARLRKRMELYRDGVQSQIKTRTKEIAAELLAALTETLKNNPPPQWSSRHINVTLTDADVKRLFFEDIQQELEKVETDFDPAIRIDYKEITYATFVDKDFRKLIEARFGKEEISRIFDEHDAAPEQRKDEDEEKED